MCPDCWHSPGIVAACSCCCCGCFCSCCCCLYFCTDSYVVSALFRSVHMYIGILLSPISCWSCVLGPWCPSLAPWPCPTPVGSVNHSHDKHNVNKESAASPLVLSNLLKQCPCNTKSAINSSSTTWCCWTPEMPGWLCLTPCW